MVARIFRVREFWSGCQDWSIGGECQRSATRLVRFVPVSYAPVIMSLSQTGFANFLLVFVSVTSGCHSWLGPALVGSGVSAKEERTVEPFSKMEMGGALNVQVTVGEATSVQITGDDNIVPIVTSEVRSGTLHLHMDHQGTVRPKQTLLVTVTTPELSKIQVSGACDVDIVDVVDNQVEVSLSGASRMDISGTCERFNADVSGASKLDALALSAGSVQVNASGASHAQVHSIEAITGAASGASSIRYSGDPAVAEVNSSGASSAKAVSR